MAKNHLFGKTIFWQTKKAIFFENFDQKVPKNGKNVGFLAKNYAFHLFKSKFSKTLPYLKIWKNKTKQNKNKKQTKKKLLECVLTWFSSNFSIFNSKLFF